MTTLPRAGAAPRRGFAREALILAGGAGVAHALWLVVAPVLSRHYGATAFGQLGVFIAIATVVATVLTGRYEVLIVAEKDEASAAALGRLCVVLATAGATILAVALVLLPNAVTSASWTANLGSWIPATALAGLTLALFATGNSWLNRLGRVGAMATAKVAQGVTLAAAALGLALAGVADGLLTAQLTGAGVGILVVAVAVYQCRPARRRAVPIRSVARRHIDAPRYLLPAAILDVASAALPVFLISGWFGTELAGQYSLAWRVLIAPAALVGAAVGQVFFRRFARALEDSGDPAGLLSSTWQALLIIGLPGALLLSLFGPALFAFVFSPVWSSAGLMSAILAPMLLAMFVSSPTSTMYVVLGLQRMNLWFGVLSIITRPSALAIGFYVDSVYVGLAVWAIIEIAKVLVFNLIGLRHLREAPPLGSRLQREL